MYFRTLYFCGVAVLSGVTAVSADVIEGRMEIDAVTVHPLGAVVNRTVSFEAAAGRHTVVVSGLPSTVVAEAMRVYAPEGVVLLSSTLGESQRPVVAEGETPEVVEARAVVARLSAEIDTLEAQIARLRAPALAAAEQLAFLRGLGAAMENADLERIRQTTALIGELGADAVAQMQAAEAGAAEAEQRLSDLQEDMRRAREILSERLGDNQEQRTLTLDIDVSAGGAVSLEMVNVTLQASWQPTYDLYLSTDDGSLDILRAMAVEQRTGEDWRDVALTVSTARLDQSSEPQQVFGQRQGVISDEDWQLIQDRGLGGYATEIVEPPVVIVEAEAPRAPQWSGSRTQQGLTVLYTYDRRVNVRSAAGVLRLDLDVLSFPAELSATASARQEDAYLVANWSNGSEEMLVGGTAALFRDTVLVGSTDLDVIPPGASVDVGFGVIEGLVLDRRLVDEQTGAAGLGDAVTERVRSYEIEVENFTDRSWDVRVLDGFSFSGQEELAVRVIADPDPSVDRPEGQRGTLAWDLTLAPGQSQSIAVTETLTWPEGYRLQ